ncbi:winged helix-turn-helix transcriptional regulator [Jatrophihabitans fulvus]
MANKVTRPARAARTTGRPDSVAATLDVVGERWALLAIREIDYGNHRFDAIARNTAASRDILTTRLRGLEEAGVIERRQYQDNPPRFEYHLTKAGADLRPVLAALRAWGDRWVLDKAPVTLKHSCGKAYKPRTYCPACNQDVDVAKHPDDVTERFVAPGWDRTGPTE